MANGFKTIFTYASLAIPLYVIASVKMLIPEPNGLRLKISVTIIRILIITLLIPLLILLLLFFAVYFEFAKFLAKFYFGDSYYDNLNGSDVVWNNNDHLSKSIIHILFLLESEAKTPEELLKFCQHHVLEVVFKNHPRLTCLRKSFLGYVFFIKIKEDYGKFIRYFDDYNSLEEFQEVLNDISGSDLPFNGESMLEILIGRKPLEIKPGKLSYPIMTRFHHSTADGLGLATLLMTSVAQNGMEIFKMECDKFNQIFEKSKKSKKSQSLKNLCKTVLNAHCHCEFIHSKEPENILQRQLTGQKIIAYSFESSGDNLIQKIKDIKNALGIGFADVILGVVSASLLEFYRNHDDIPREICSLNPYFVPQGKFNEMVSIGKNGEAVTKLGNNFGVGLVELPLDLELHQKPADVLKKINESTNDIKQNMDFPFTYWIFKVPLTIIPKIFVELFAKMLHSTVAITNVPGVTEFKLKNDCRVEDMVIWTNNFQKTAVTFTFFTYKNCMRVSTHVDRGLIDNREEVQALSDGIFKNIQRFYEDICKKEE